MHFFITESSGSDKLIRAQKLMQIAMKRLEVEFYRILSTNRNSLDAESVSSRTSRASTRASLSDSEDDTSDEELNSVAESDRVSEIVMKDLKVIADCMISTGYGKECVKIYKLIRKSIVDESLYNLGVDRSTSSQINKMEWDVIDYKIKNWLHNVKVAVKTLFYGERILCDHVFSASDKIRESCFADISREGALSLFAFPENVAKGKKSPEKMFRILDLYDTISELWPEMEFIFSFESTSTVRAQAVAALVKLGEAVRLMLADFEAAIQKDSSKSVVTAGGVHPLARYVMNYVVFLCDYSGILSDIVTDWPLTIQSPLPETYTSSPIPGGIEPSAISERLAWIILVLLCKLDGKANIYKDVSQSYLFLANNLNYVVSKVKTSNLKLLLGDDWLAKHEMKVRQYAANYERMSWNKVFSSLPDNPAAVLPETARDCFQRFNAAFEEAYRKQMTWVISDSKLRDEIKVSVAKKIVPVYRNLYESYRGTFRSEIGVDSVVRYAPEDLANYLSDLFYGNGVSGSNNNTVSYSYSSSAPSSSPSPSRER